MKKIKITKEQFDKITNLLKEGLPTIKTNEVDKAFKQAFLNKDIKNLGENESEFKISSPLKGVSASKQGKFMKESTGDLKSETMELIKYLYRKSEELSQFWVDNNLTYDDICDTLESKGLIIKKDGKYTLSKSLGSAEEAIKAVENELSQLIGGDKEEVAVATELDEEEGQASQHLTVVTFNREYAILEDSNGDYYAFYYHEYKPNIEEYIDAPITGGELHREPVGGGEIDNEIDYEYGDKEITAEAIQEFVNDNINQLSKGYGVEGTNDGMDINKLDEPLKNEILGIGYKPNDSNNKEFLAFLNNLSFNDESLNEMHGEDEDSFIQRKMANGLSQKTAKTLYNIRQNSDRQDTERFANRDAANDAANIDKLKSKVQSKSEPKKPVGQYNMFGGVDETSTTGSVGGAFTAPLGAEPIKKEMPIVTNVKVVKEGFELGKGYTHFAIFKADGKIATGWDYSSLYDKYEKGYDNESIKEYSKEDIKSDFPENKVSDFKIVTRKALEKKGINPLDTNNWYKTNVNETTDVASAGNFQYDTPGGLTMDLGKNNPKTKAEKTPQWAGGEFVEQPDCSKLNNNKEAQNGGCNTGASSLKTKKAKGSINAPSLGENKIYETIAKKTGLSIDEVKRIIESKTNKS